MDRRQFLAAAAVTAAAPAIGAPARKPGPVCFFSKHLPKLSPREMAHQLRAAGYDGIELTVRPGGHVAPDAVEKALPKAIEDIRAEGMDVPIIATALLSSDDRSAVPILSTAAKLGVPLFRPGWFSYGSDDVRQQLKQASATLKGLAEVGAKAKIALAYQNHVGQLGAALWDLDALVAPLDPRWAGVYFDIRHAVAEGTAGSWKTAAQLVAPRVKVFSVKDFYWERDAKSSSWVARDCALGQGMVDVKTPLAIFRKHGFAGPITVFNEHETRGEDAVVAAAAKDLKYLRAQMA